MIKYLFLWFYWSPMFYYLWSSLPLKRGPDRDKGGWWYTLPSTSSSSPRYKKVGSRQPVLSSSVTFTLYLELREKFEKLPSLNTIKHKCTICSRVLSMNRVSSSSNYKHLTYSFTQVHRERKSFCPFLTSPWLNYYRREIQRRTLRIFSILENTRRWNGKSCYLIFKWVKVPFKIS